MTIATTLPRLDLCWQAQDYHSQIPEGMTADEYRVAATMLDAKDILGPAALARLGELRARFAAAPGALAAAIAAADCAA